MKVKFFKSEHDANEALVKTVEEHINDKKNLSFIKILPVKNKYAFFWM